MLENLKKWWQVHLTVITTIIVFIDPSIQQWASGHPKYTAAVMAVWMLILGISKSPLQGGSSVPIPGPSPSPQPK
jgi:hypothetical protein